MMYTKQAIEAITEKKVKYVREMAYVVLAVFEHGRSQFISKGQISYEVFQWDCGWMTQAFSKEWQIHPQPFKKNVKKNINPLEAYKLAISLGCNVRQDWWTPVNPDKEKIILRRPSEKQLMALAANDPNWDTQWGVYPISA